MRRSRLRLAPLGALFLVCAGGVGAQEVEGGDLVADIDPAGATEVRAMYEVRPERTEAIPLLGLEVMGARVSSLEVRFLESGAWASVPIQRAPSGRLTATISIPGTERARSVVRIELRYRVDQPTPSGEGRFDHTIPILLVDHPPVGDRPELLTARWTLPDGYSVSESFPLVPLDPAIVDGRRSYAITLPVVPSMLRIRGTRGARPFLTFGRLVDGTVVCVLLLLAGWGWREATSDRETRSGPAPE